MIKEPQISVLMPTYNDSKYISTAIKSLLNQSYKNLELIVIDGSTDETPKIIKEFAEIDSRIKYLREQRSGQLNALAHGAQFIRGKYVTLLHSDDELSDNKAFERNISAIEQNSCDGIFCELLLMNENGEVQRRTKTVKSLDSSSPVLLFLRAGSNIIPDFFFVKKEIFDNVLSGYITWNIPYWLKFEGTSISTLKLRKVDSWYKYRVYPENYIRSDVGKFEIANGCLRTVLEIGQRINLSLLSLQILLARVFKTRMKPLFKIGSCSPQHLREMVMRVINSRFKKIPQNIYFNGLLGFYSNFPSKRTIKLHFDEEEEIFLGKDARIFYNSIGKKLPTTCEYVLREATNGFGIVSVEEKDYERARNMMRFLNLLTKIEIE
jgi:glycosyltransferase involved in cell wall biosynthesis